MITTAAVEELPGSNIRIMTRTKKPRGLYRPRKPINFQISSADSSIASDQGSVSYRLRKQILLLDLIVRRHKNQHRSQLFFKQVQTLRRALRQLLALHTQLDDLSATKLTKSADEVRRRFEQEATLRSQREVAEEHIREVLVPKCYVAFSNVVADLPFANLGVVLMGILSEVAAGRNGIGLPVSNNEDDQSYVEKAQTTSKGRSSGSLSDTEEPLVLGISTRMTGEDHGEVVERRYGHKEKLTYEYAEPVPIGLQDLEKDGSGISAHIALDNGYTKPVESENDSKPVESSSVEVKRSKSKIKEKKPKKKKNALDDLFSKLI